MTACVVSFLFVQSSSFAGMMAWQPDRVDCVTAESSQFMPGASHGESRPSSFPVVMLDAWAVAHAPDLLR
jgi:hypothetical protein